MGKHLIKATVTTLTGPSFKMAVLLDLMERYPDKFLPGTDYVASFGIHDDFPGYKPLDGTPLSPNNIREGSGDRVAPPGKGTGGDRGGCHKTEMTHSEQVTDTSSLNMFFNDELFTQMVLGSNFFRVAGLESIFSPPPLCRHDPDVGMTTVTKPWMPNQVSMTMDIVDTSTQPADKVLVTSAPSWTISAFAVFILVTLGLVIGLVY